MIGRPSDEASTVIAGRLIGTVNDWELGGREVDALHPAAGVLLEERAKRAGTRAHRSTRTCWVKAGRGPIVGGAPGADPSARRGRLAG